MDAYRAQLKSFDPEIAPAITGEGIANSGASR